LSLKIVKFTVSSFSSLSECKIWKIWQSNSSSSFKYFKYFKLWLSTRRLLVWLRDAKTKIALLHWLDMSENNYSYNSQNICFLQKTDKNHEHVVQDWDQAGGCIDVVLKFSTLSVLSGPTRVNCGEQELPGFTNLLFFTKARPFWYWNTVFHIYKII